MGFLTRVPVSARTVVVVLIAVAALLCLGELARSAVALATGQDCFGPGCEDQIACGQPAQPQASPGFSTQVVALGAAVRMDLAPPLRETVVVARAPAISSWQSVALFAPRSPPAV
jgi:hypothetical protein